MSAVEIAVVVVAGAILYGFLSRVAERRALRNEMRNRLIARGLEQELAEAQEKPDLAELDRQACERERRERRG